MLLRNDLVRVAIEQPGRSVGPLLSGGGLIDADLVRPEGQGGRDVFGRMGLFYALGRLSSVTEVEVLADGSQGGPAVVASTGKDVAHDLLNLKSLLGRVAGLPLELAVDPSVPLDVRATTYHVLSPSEARVRVLTAFCNDSDQTVKLPLIELLDVGAFELFNPGGCANGLGTSKLDDSDCVADRSRWVGTQGDGVAYGVRSQSLTDVKKPVKANAVIGYGGVVGSFIEGENLQGLLSWFDPAATSRPGTFNVLAKTQRAYLRDFIIAKDLAGVGDVIAAADGQVTGTVELTVLPGGQPSAEGARVSVIDASNVMATLIVADGDGRGRATLPPGDYRASATRAGLTIGQSVPFTVTATQTTQATLTLGEGRALSVTVKDLANQPSPAKVTAFCANGPCPLTAASYARHLLVDPPPMRAAAIGAVPLTGQLTLSLPPGEYDVVVSRGPEYSTWPDTWPMRGARVDLRTQDASVTASLGKVVDSSGWSSADLHVHGVNSTDSAVLNEVRVATFIAEGVDVLLSTDHEVITDFAPVVRALNAEHLIATMVGEEVTSFDHGHFNAFPLVQDASQPNGGAFDHAGGEDGPTLRMPQVFAGLKAAHPGSVVQLNHPRGGSGVLTQLRVDTASLATHAAPTEFGMVPSPDATADDTRLLGDGFDAVESANGTSPSFAVLNDWMTFLSRGTVRTATGVSDTHQRLSDSPGYSRTYAKVANETPQGFSPAAFAEAIRTQQAFITNGPFLNVTAQKLDASSQPVGPQVGIGQTLSVSANDAVRLTVDVQGPEWMQLDRLEVFSHAPGREATNGQSNGTWPDARTLERKVLSPASLKVEPVPGTALRRLHVTETVVVRPARDSWYVVMVRGTGGLTMRPLHGDRPWALANAVLIDADGSGRYDDFPLKPGQPLKVAAQPQRPRVPTADELARAIVKLLEHRHE